MEVDTNPPFSICKQDERQTTEAHSKSKKYSKLGSNCAKIRFKCVLNLPHYTMEMDTNPSSSICKHDERQTTEAHSKSKNYSKLGSNCAKIRFKCVLNLPHYTMEMDTNSSSSICKHDERS
ncbi:hypothetical protein HNY73_009545 [Argiope bruennichi]|uniref:Uncharacterized protein n=1 Tax=Argiope bruennichi TaxID=94029 RepID=A0A8T0FCE3_ARGBR|nr:hypothetical protein HNY73_009545 [Argiope bruennichi]